MLYGREYAKGSSDCIRCEMHSKSLELRTCDSCGERGCDFCIESRDYGTDNETGYRDIEYLCGECANRKDYPRALLDDLEPLNQAAIADQMRRGRSA